jgi:putative addiction module CopG family antidote
MKISLSPDVERLIAEELHSGRYQSADEVVREGLELLREAERQGKGLPTNGGGKFADAFANIASSVPEAYWEKVPADLSKNLDRYLYDGHKTS